MDNLDTYLQFGAMGLLGLFMLRSSLLMEKVMNQALIGFSSISKSLDRLADRVDALSDKVEARHDDVIDEIHDVHVDVVRAQLEHEDDNGIDRLHGEVGNDRS